MAAKKKKPATASSRASSSKGKKLPARRRGRPAGSKRPRAKKQGRQAAKRTARVGSRAGTKTQAPRTKKSTEKRAKKGVKKTAKKGIEKRAKKTTKKAVKKTAKKTAKKGVKTTRAPRRETKRGTKRSTGVAKKAAKRSARSPARPTQRKRSRTAFTPAGVKKAPTRLDLKRAASIASDLKLAAGKAKVRRKKVESRLSDKKAELTDLRREARAAKGTRHKRQLQAAVEAAAQEILALGKKSRDATSREKHAQELAVEARRAAYALRVRAQRVLRLKKFQEQNQSQEEALKKQLFGEEPVVLKLPKEEILQELELLVKQARKEDAIPAPSDTRFVPRPQDVGSNGTWESENKGLIGVLSHKRINVTLRTRGDIETIVERAMIRARKVVKRLRPERLYGTLTLLSIELGSGSNPVEVLERNGVSLIQSFLGIGTCATLAEFEEMLRIRLEALLAQRRSAVTVDSITIKSYRRREQEVEEKTGTRFPAKKKSEKVDGAKMKRKVKGETKTKK